VDTQADVATVERLLTGTAAATVVLAAVAWQLWRRLTKREDDLTGLLRELQSALARAEVREGQTAAVLARLDDSMRHLCQEMRGRTAATESQKLRVANGGGGE